MVGSLTPNIGRPHAHLEWLPQPYKHQFQPPIKIDSVTEQISDRSLGSNDNFESLLVDRDGEEYEAYSLAWRYLGMYMDCDVDTNDARRKLEDDEGSSCERVLLWAAYVDPRYKGGSIGEYQFYDLSAKAWDKSTCRTKRCARMDCHEPNTHFKLIGVFKETDGMYDWAEQLFKHQGYCVWDEDTYEYMQTYLGNWPTYCSQLMYTDDDGNTLYLHSKPLPEGNVTMGIFLDSSCSQESALNISDYIKVYYENYYGDADQGASVAVTWEGVIDNWNAYMDVYRICQPCRAYSRTVNSNSNEDEDDGERKLDYSGNDGEGDEEQWGYNCYDDAGYTNCNQCYKFEAKTDMEAADTSDLVKASKQGTILAIKVNGRTYGSGGFRSSGGGALAFVALFMAGLAVGGIAFWGYRQYIKRKRKALPPSLKENFSVQDGDAVVA